MSGSLEADKAQENIEMNSVNNPRSISRMLAEHHKRGSLKQRSYSLCKFGLKA
jgi:hypothetical protein